nr:retrotransposon protein, putative, Ty3-gypsy subclass [Tanacetum cinerariifolium]
MRQRRWLELLKDYDTNIQYHPGKANIKEAQKEDSEIWTIVENLNKQVEFRLDDDNVLWQDTRLVVPNDVSLREALLIEAHSSPFSVHPEELDALDAAIDKGYGSDDIVNKRIETVENDVFEAVKHFFTYGDILKGFNSSFIALILKILDANLVKDFRPISLIGSISKII